MKKVLQAQHQEKSPRVRWRELDGLPRLTLRVLLSSLPIIGTLFIFQIHQHLGIVLLREQYLGIFLALVMSCVFLGAPPRPHVTLTYVPWYDYTLVFFSLLTGGYITLFYPRLLYEAAYLTPDKWLMGSISVVLILEAARRLVGWPLVIVGGLFILYGRFTYLFPGILHGNGIEWKRLFAYLLLDSNGIYGLPLGIAGTIVLAFILFAQVLFLAGGGKFLTELSLALMGRFRGGPAKVAILSSSLFGTISGSAVGNVMTTGVVTIPMMQNIGYRSHIAGAIEAVASTGGQLMPPVMGAAAFLIAEFLSLPYSQVALAALMPAVLYYLGLFVQVDLEARKHGIKPTAKENIPKLGPILKKSWVFTIPFFVLIYTLFISNYQPDKSALLSAISVLLVAAIGKQTRGIFRSLLSALEAMGKPLLEIGVIVAIAGFIVGIISTTGLGFNLAFNLVRVAGGSVMFLLLLTAIIALILGMGMPTIPAYIILSILVAPALEQLGIMPLAAHLFIFYFGILCMITPPVCFASYAAAAIAGSDALKTGFEAMKLASIAYFVPFIFVFSPSLLLMGSAKAILLAISTSFIGIFALAISLNGFLFQPIANFKRSLLFVCAIGLVIPPTSSIPMSWLINLIGLFVILPFFFWEWSKLKRFSPS
jgi:TRAP transporter 4TM/12TM fusion protein